jgi:hypothetical protein
MRNVSENFAAYHNTHFTVNNIYICIYIFFFQKSPPLGDNVRKKQCVFVFALQQLLGESATMSRCTYINYLVHHTIRT